MKIEDKLAVNKYDIDRDSHITIHEDVCRSCPDQPCLSACPAGCFSLVDGGILFSLKDVSSAGAAGSSVRKGRSIGHCPALVLVFATNMVKEACF